jgi:hypothetical protein
MFNAQEFEKLKAMVPAQAPAAAAPQAGQPQRSAVQPGGPPASYDDVNAEIQRMTTENPQMAEQLKQELMAIMQTGELTPEELNKMVQLARAALQQPNLYPQIRRFAVQQGLGTEQDIPEQFDQGLLIAIVIAGQALQGAAPEGQAQGAETMPSMKEGGALPTKSGNKDGSIPINAHEGEFVVPAEVVRHYGTKFFEDLKVKMEKRNEVPTGAADA